ncbi:MAG: transporter solute receptor, family [Deltaproteobacteria bacterium]|nr:transporter solute receptor, family [Deltaproteobacteria bacterium]
MKKIPDVFVLFFLAMFLGLPVSALAVEEIHFGTSTVGGIYYQIGMPMCQVINKYLAAEYHATAETTIGSVENIRLLGQGKIQLGLALPLMAANAMNGAKPFNEKIPLRMVMRTIPVVNLFVVMANSNIKTIDDLKGKRVNLGQPGGLDQNSLATLQAYGLTIKDIKPSVLGVGAGVDALKDGKMDAVITTIPLINQLKATHEIRVLWVDEPHIQKIISAQPAYGKWLMPPGQIKDLKEQKWVPDFGSALFTSESAKPEFVYKVTKALLDHKNELEEMFVQYKTLSKEMAAQALGAPLHDGSVKYFQEIGILKK